MEDRVVKQNDTVVCYAPSMITTNGIWQSDNPLNYSLPLFVLQLTLVVVTTRFLVLILKPLRQPRVIAEILGGVILGPSLFGQNEEFANTVFPIRSVMVLETMANIGLLYFIFLIGLATDLNVLRRTGKQAFVVALSGMIIPFIIGIFFSYFLREKAHAVNQYTFMMFLSVALSVTAFPVLSRILAELKLLNTDIGRLAMSSALVMDAIAWILLAFAVALADEGSTSVATVSVLLSSVGFVFFCTVVVRPMVGWMVNRTRDGESISDFCVCLVLAGVLISGFVTDAIGTNAVFGAFVFGLVIPNGQLEITLIEKLEDFVSGLLLPLFFATSGLKTNVTQITGVATWFYLILVVVLSLIGKVVGTLIATTYYQMPLRDGVTLGLLMNSKGLIEVIVLNIGKDQNVLDEKTFAIMVVIAMSLTSMIMPSVTSIYKPTRKFAPYKRRSIQLSRPDVELKILVCIHTQRNVPTIVNLLEASYPSKRSPICVYVLHLVELTGRASAMLIANHNRPTANPTKAQSDNIIRAFSDFERTGYVSIQPLTAISPYSTMHDDICWMAEDKRVSFIIIPFHKQQTVDGGMESVNSTFRSINQNVLENAACSVGILVDRGLSPVNEVSHHVVVLFFGGRDDREALAYGWRMSEHPAIRLMVIRFLPGNLATEMENRGGSTFENVDKRRDEDYVNEFRAWTSNNESVRYVEQVVNNGEETMACIRSIDPIHDLFIVGRDEGRISPLKAGLTDWSECPELGAIGDLIASSDFAISVSVLVVQQYSGTGMLDDEFAVQESPTRVPQNYQYSNFSIDGDYNRSPQWKNY
ncbi:cation/H(+) antiporter 15-like [Impatiens glandulifera]|uniref:cation/H(+) antiporter 15-like n=1 Tax=Impatiens glandulifera TaxID=253017 RepID=UPI001FB13478|nr:cation/H(+) antiporter 15-like [Impatiens glandulifera]